MRNPIRQQTTDRRNTMAEIEWDNKKHYFGGAEHPRYGTVIMLRHGSSVDIECLSNRYGSYQVFWLRDEELVPTGKRYTFTEVQDD